MRIDSLATPKVRIASSPYSHRLMGTLSNGGCTLIAFPLLFAHVTDTPVSAAVTAPRSTAVAAPTPLAAATAAATVAAAAEVAALVAVATVRAVSATVSVLTVVTVTMAAAVVVAVVKTAAPEAVLSGHVVDKSPHVLVITITVVVVAVVTVEMIPLGDAIHLVHVLGVVVVVQGHAEHHRR